MSNIHQPPSTLATSLSRTISPSTLAFKMMFSNWSGRRSRVTNTTPGGGSGKAPMVLGVSAFITSSLEKPWARKRSISSRTRREWPRFYGRQSSEYWQTMTSSALLQVARSRERPTAATATPIMRWRTLKRKFGRCITVASTPPDDRAQRTRNPEHRDKRGTEKGTGNRKGDGGTEKGTEQKRGRSELTVKTGYLLIKPKNSLRPLFCSSVPFSARPLFCFPRPNSAWTAANVEGSTRRYRTPVPNDWANTRPP